MLARGVFFVTVAGEWIGSQPARPGKSTSSLPNGPG
jgi:hypothetical protein